MNDTKVMQARFSDDYSHIIDSDDNKVEFNDPRVVHVWAVDTSLYSSRLIASMYQSQGWKFRYTGETDAEVLQYAKKLCSGRECLPCASLTGATLRDILNNREEDEISIYYNLDQEGPCQNGAWPVLWDTFAKRLNLKNIVFLACPNIKNNYLGQYDIFAAKIAISGIIGDILDEAENSLLCLAKDKDSAMRIFRDATDCIINSSKNGITPLVFALIKWAKKIAEIQLRASVEETPKVLLIGGINVMFLHYPVTNFIIDQGMIPKSVEFREFISLLNSEYVIRYGFKRGLMTPKEQLKISSILLSIFGRKNSLKEIITALRGRLHLIGVDFMTVLFRRIMSRSGLLFDIHTPLVTLAEEGHKYISNNGVGEAPITTGKYICSVKNAIFDGLINIGSFNCQPAMNTQAIISPLANKNDVPYISIDCEGPWISTSQRRLLETLALGAKRLREKRNRTSILKK